LLSPKIGVYAGKGSSHSWLWFVDLFERLGFYNQTLLDETGFQNGAWQGLDFLAVSGGDTITMAEGMGSTGAARLNNFIQSGGVYLGSCAGAYLPLNSSKEHLHHFNFVPAKITNLVKEIPSTVRLPEKSIMPYGCSFLYHPVREEVELAPSGIPPFDLETPIRAPLYGGPGMIPSSNSTVLARYEAFTPRTLFLVDELLARQTLIGKAAVIRESLGDGVLYLFGPHCEHPHFPSANQCLARVMAWEQSHRLKRGPGNIPAKGEEVVSQGPELKQWIRDLKREISHSRLVANGLETLEVRWLIGNKIYEPLKIRFFLEAIWGRLNRLEKERVLAFPGAEKTYVIEKALELTKVLRVLKGKLDEGQETLEVAEKVFETLQHVTRAFLTVYFFSKIKNSPISGGLHL
jgi:glutamine amidotransferase-like uncharacterized protein